MDISSLHFNFYKHVLITYHNALNMQLINDEYRTKLKEQFSTTMVDEVTIKVFKDDNKSCQYCNDTEQLMREIAEITDKVKVEIHELGDEESKKYKIEKAPVVILFSDRFQNGNVRYFGIPSGYEFRSIIEDIETFSTGKIELRESTIDKLKTIEKPVSIRVFITPTCPYCPSAVRMAHNFALVNPNITGDMVESYEFEEEAEAAAVSSVPHTTISNIDEPIIGAQPEEIFLDQVLFSAAQAP
ncbi:thiol-disulfide isomerase or thioredoxin [Cuniculiplasma divulgatum]|jgi:glutaredoxin-like protein|uniref:Thiol-disulfide isomerase or thioredoxin n=2 Tax=Cuniculiplasma divulgatum TaxID=1673428 RepID=A0A1N5SFS7_9ARCH|nr:thiol-disulfide isomerase or thioredoxin [Cuniculiplasma divulgatum]SJK84068.1 thiol-disulfide isomerase or thioredoxin [Cuniculiplasma divulgatum]